MNLTKARYLLFAVAALLSASSKTTAQTADGDSVINIGYSKDNRYIGYGQQSAKVVTSAISTRKGEELRKAFTNNISNALYGRFAGLFVNQGGNEPGGNNAVPYIRGVNTFGFNQAPLVIIDGFLGDYTQLVPEEIEEISVLKDASATAVYGMRGANGVILVTTKKGHSGPLRVSFGAQYGIQQATALPQFLDAYNYASLYNEALANDGRTPLYTQADLDAYKNGTDRFFRPNVNWYDEVLRERAPLSNYNLSFSGGSGSVRFFTTLNALTSDGLFKNFGDDFAESSNSRYSRYNLRTNVEVNLNNDLVAQLNIGGSLEDKKNPGGLYSSGTLGLIDRIAPNAFPVRNPNGSFGGNSTYSGNPLADLASTGFSTSTGTTLQSSLRFTQKLPFITKGLSATAAISFNNYYVGGSNKRKSYQRFGISRNATGDTVYTAFGQQTSLNPEESVLSQFRNYAVQGGLDYNRIFGNHSLSAMVLFNSDNFDINRDYPATDAANQSFPYKANSLSSRITYVHKQRYIAEFSAGYMGTENFAPGKRYGFFPAGSIGWIASNENFLKNNSLVSFLKLRASYGLTGNENIGGQRFAFAQRYPFGASYFFGTGNVAVGSLSEGRRVNPDVTWEKEKKANIGVDLNIGKKFGVVVDVFKNDRYDISTSSAGTLPLFLGYNGFPDLNIGKATSKGYEVTVSYRSNEAKPFQFFAEAMVSYATNKIEFNGEAVNPNVNLYRTGSAIGQPFGLQALGLFQTDAEIAASAKPVGVTVRPGDIRYHDIGGPNGVPDGVIDANDVTAIGKTSIPEYTAGLHTGIRYKGFDLDLVFQGVSGVTQYLGGARYAAFQNNGQVAELALDRWTPQNTDATHPRLSIDGDQNNYRFSSFWQRDGSFVKLRSAEIGYTFSENMLKRFRLSQSRLFINGTNLFTLDRIKEGDADALYGYPQLRTISVGLRIQL